MPEDEKITYTTFKRAARSFEEFSKAEKETVDTGLLYSEALKACAEFNDNRTADEEARGLKMEFERE